MHAGPISFLLLLFVGANTAIWADPIEMLAAPTLPSPASAHREQKTIILPAKEPAQDSFTLGVTNLRKGNFQILQGKRVGLLTQGAALDERGMNTIDILYNAPNVKLTALFAPEHGVRGEINSNYTFHDGVDNKTHLMIYSLYYGSRRPTPRMLKSIDIMVIDIQDIGTRSYTYISAMKYALQGCLQYGIPVVILDRPNPLGGIKADGPVLDNKYRSYVGTFQIPYVHGLTMGELALYALDSFPQRGTLYIVKMSGWHRSMLWGDTGLRWEPTSGAIPTADDAFAYACVGLGSQLGGFEHGMGTAYPFRLLTHPKLTPQKLKERLDKEGLPGYEFEVRKIPHGMAGEGIEGVFLNITDWNKADPIALNLLMLRIDQEEEGAKPFIKSKGEQLLFNKHWGIAEPLESLKAGKLLNVEALAAKWRKEAQDWQEKSKKYWLYN